MHMLSLVLCGIKCGPYVYQVSQIEGSKAFLTRYYLHTVGICCRYFDIIFGLFWDSGLAF